MNLNRVGMNGKGNQPLKASSGLDRPASSSIATSYGNIAVNMSQENGRILEDKRKNAFVVGNPVSSSSSGYRDRNWSKAKSIPRKNNDKRLKENQSSNFNNLVQNFNNKRKRTNFKPPAVSRHFNLSSKPKNRFSAPRRVEESINPPERDFQQEIVNNQDDVDDIEEINLINKKIPGPAGSTNIVQSNDTEKVVNKFDVVKSHFSQGAWLSMLYKYRLPIVFNENDDNFITRYNIRNITKDQIGELIHIPKLAVVIVRLEILDYGATAILADQTGKIEAELHEDILKVEEWGLVECDVLILKKVTVFKPHLPPSGCGTHSIMITKENIEKVFKANSKVPEEFEPLVPDLQNKLMESQLGESEESQNSIISKQEAFAVNEQGNQTLKNMNLVNPKVQKSYNRMDEFADILESLEEEMQQSQLQSKNAIVDKIVKNADAPNTNWASSSSSSSRNVNSAKELESQALPSINVVESSTNEVDWLNDNLCADNNNESICKTSQAAKSKEDIDWPKDDLCNENSNQEKSLKPVDKNNETDEVDWLNVDLYN